MSNVLIGIIGVILFIGLALAGAMILGNDFLSAGNSSKASAHVSRVQQIAQAAAMYQLKTGRRITTGTDPSFLVPRFLKTLPTGSYELNDWGTGPTAVSLELPYTDANRAICEEIQRQTGQIGASAPFDDGSITGRSLGGNVGKRIVGCIVHNLGDGSLSYSVFSLF